MLLQKLLEKLDKEPGYGMYALRLLDSIPNVSSKDVYSQGTRIFKTVATLGRDDLAQELLSSAAAKKLALCAEELGESAQLQALVLWMKAVIANQSYDETLCRDVVNQTENLFQNNLSAIPFEMLADLTFSRHILKEEHASYACRLIDEGEDRDDVLAAALGQLLLKPSGESAAGAVTRMEDTIQSLEQHSDDAESCSVKAKLMNRQGSIQKGMASGQVEDPGEAMLGFSRAQQTIRKAIAARLRAPGKIDTTGLQMDYQTLGDTYVGWSKIAKSTHKLELLANAEAAYRMKLKYAQSSTRDLWGRVLGLCSLGDVLWMTARLVEPDNADLVPIGDELKSVFLESRQLSSESAPHHAQPQFQDRAKPWAYNMQCWALVRLCYSDIGSDTDRFRWKYVYDSIVPSCDRMLNATAMEEEGCDPNRPMNVIDASRTPIQTRLVFLPMEKCSLRQRLVGELWLGVGESAGEGVLNHQLEKGDSTAGLVLDNPQRAHSPLVSDNPVIVTHSHPNLDAIAAIWLATRSVAKLPFSEFDRTLVERIARWNQGNVELTDALENSWEIAFYKALEECPDDAARVTLGMGMLDLSAFLACQREGYDWPSIAAALLDDYQRIDLKREEALFEEDVISSETLDLTRIPGLHNQEPSRILCLTDPHTSGTTIKFMAKRDKYAGSIVSRRLRKIAPIQVWRHWIRIDPDKGSLQGLDLLLDKHEAKELELVGHSADISLGSWHDWCGHDDNRADSPPIRVGDLVLRGSLLTPAQIRQILVEVYG